MLESRYDPAYILKMAGESRRDGCKAMARALIAAARSERLSPHIPYFAGGFAKLRNNT